MRGFAPISRLGPLRLVIKEIIVPTKEKRVNEKRNDVLFSSTREAAVQVHLQHKTRLCSDANVDFVNCS